MLEAAAPNDSEAHQVLMQMAGRRTLPVPGELIVRHVLLLPGEWDWPVRRAAMEAVLRRFGSVRGQELVVLEAPGKGPWGRYRLGRSGADGALPYDVRLWSVDPLAGSCDCADFLRASLGLCKHMAAALMHVAASARGLRRALNEPAETPQPFTIVWDPTSPASDGPDPLVALRLSRPANGGASQVPSGLGLLFRTEARGDWRLRSTHPENSEKRLRLVQAIRQQVRKKKAFTHPAVPAILSEEEARLARIFRLADRAGALREGVARAKRRLYRYQKEGVARMLSQGRLVLADDMGLGKTTQAIVAASALHHAGLVRRGLFVVPASLKPQWEREWRAVSAAPLRVVEGGAEERREIYRAARRGFLVTNYEQVVRDVDTIAEWSPDFIALDEAQRMKNWATKTALTIKRLKPEYRLVLTGTPMENRLDELASVVEWVDDRVLEPKWRLGPWHSVYADGKREVVGARNLDELRRRLAPVMLRRVRAEVLAQLPARQDSLIPVELTDHQREAHDDLNQPIAKLARIAERRPLAPSEFLRLMSLLASQRMIANGMGLIQFEARWPVVESHRPTPELVQSLAAPKLAELQELLANLVLVQKRKVVVFSQWRRMLELAAWATSDLLASADLRALFFTGQEGPRRRTQNLVDFHDDPRAAVLFLTDAGGVGLNLQKAASACINLELPWNPAVLEQRIGRIHRLGQTRPIDVYNLVSRGCIEERIAGLVTDKKALFKGLFEGTTDELRFDRQRTLLNLVEQVTTPAPSQAGVELPPTEEPAEDTLTAGAAEDAPFIVAEASVGAVPPPQASLPADIVSGDVGNLLAAVTVGRREDGGVRIDAPPHAARALMSLFEGMARLMASATAPSAAEAQSNGSERRAPPS